MKGLRTAALATLLSGVATSAFAQAVDEIVVRGVNIPDEKKATSEISAVLDEAAFERTGDSNIADALKRVTGLSLADGKFVIARGLNERYNSATLNGSPLPSPEPLRRVAPLDLFPTSVLSGSLVQKTYSPEFSAEFGGSAIDLRTKSVPDEDFFEVELGVGLDTVTTARDGLTYDGGDLDWLGFDDGTRSVPAALQPFFTDQQLNVGALTEDEQNAIDVSLDNDATLVLFEEPTAPNWNVRLNGGQRFNEDGAVTFGYVASIGLDTDFVTREGSRRRGTAVNAADGSFDTNQGSSAQVRSTQQNVGLNGLLSVGAEIYDNHEINVTGLVLRSTTKEARIEEGINNDRNRTRNDFTEFFERQVWQFQGEGEHVFPELSDLTVDWRIAYGEASRDAPYERRVSYLFSEAAGEFRYDFTGQQNDISTLRFTRLDDQNFGGGFDLLLPLNVGDNALELKAGYAYTDKERVTSDRRFQYFADGDIAELADSRIDVIYSTPVLGSNLIDIRQAGIGLGNPDNFIGNLEVHAAYAGVDVELGPYLRLAAGGRYETSEQTTDAFITGGSLVDGLPSIDEDYFLPAATITWNPTGNLQLRAGFSQTIVRPQFREIGPVEFTNPNTDILTIGNAFLENSEIDNFDARVEWYFARGEFLTIGGFYKDIENPIEEITNSALGGGDVGRSTFVNSESAEVYGGEFEFQKNFAVDEWFTEGWLGQWASTKELVFITNYTYTQSDVDGGVAPIGVFLANGTLQPSTLSVASGRSLQGQSDHIANVQIGYEDFESRSRATVLFNYASERIFLIESGAPNNRVVERPPVLVDFVWNRTLELGGGEYDVELAIRNILGDDYDAQQVSVVNGDIVDRTVFDTYDIGRTFSIGLKRRF
ncbi:MAG: TonB-dependent receptor [Pseudomonadota bacterium]